MQGALKPGKGNRTHPDNCVTCGVPLLTRKAYAPEPKGFKWHQGKGKCGTCYERERPGNNRPVARRAAPAAVQALREENTRAGAIRYILARRERLRRQARAALLRRAA